MVSKDRRLEHRLTRQRGVGVSSLNLEKVVFGFSFGKPSSFNRHVVPSQNLSDLKSGTLVTDVRLPNLPELGRLGNSKGHTKSPAKFSAVGIPRRRSPRKHTTSQVNKSSPTSEIKKSLNEPENLQCANNSDQININSHRPTVLNPEIKINDSEKITGQCHIDTCKDEVFLQVTDESPCQLLTPLMHMANLSLTLSPHFQHLFRNIFEQALRQTLPHFHPVHSHQFFPQQSSSLQSHKTAYAESFGKGGGASVQEVLARYRKLRKAVRRDNHEKNSLTKVLTSFEVADPSTGDWLVLPQVDI